MVSSSNAISNTIGASISGVTNTLTVTNPSNTASSAARTSITVGGSSSGDPTINFNVSGVTNFELGIDNSASDSLKLSATASLGTTDTFIMTTDGYRTLPLQPAFSARHSVTQSNATGNGTVATVSYTTVIFDQNSDYNGTSTFTSPATGRYLFCGGVDMRGFTAAFSSMQLTLVTSNRSYLLGVLQSPGKVFNPAPDVSSQGVQTCDMDLGDTAHVTGESSGSTKTISFFSPGALGVHFFSGCLLV